MHRPANQPTEISAKEAEAQLVRFLSSARTIAHVDVDFLTRNYRVSGKAAAGRLLEEQLRRSAHG